MNTTKVQSKMSGRVPPSAPTNKTTQAPDDEPRYPDPLARIKAGCEIYLTRRKAGFDLNNRDQVLLSRLLVIVELVPAYEDFRIYVRVKTHLTHAYADLGKGEVGASTFEVRQIVGMLKSL